MINRIFSILVILAGVYLVAGLAVAVLFYTRWLKSIGPATAGGSWGFRVLVAPGLLALWPVVVMWVFHKKSKGWAEGAEALRRNHRLAFIALTLALALLFTAALVWRAPAFADLPTLELAFP